MAFGALLAEGIGDTIRVSLSAPPVEEVKVGCKILEYLGLRPRKFDIISCPSCGRAQVDVIQLANAVTEGLKGITAPIRVAVRGCIVNGPGEAREADLGVASGKGKGRIFIKGEVVETVPEDRIVETLLKYAHEIAATMGENEDGMGTGPVVMPLTGENLHRKPTCVEAVPADARGTGNRQIDRIQRVQSSRNTGAARASARTRRLMITLPIFIILLGVLVMASNYTRLPADNTPTGQTFATLSPNTEVTFDTREQLPKQCAYKVHEWHQAIDAKQPSTGDVQRININFREPEGAGDNLPAVMFFHGAGYGTCDNRSATSPRQCHPPASSQRS